MTLNRESVLPADKVLQRKIHNTVKKLFKAFCSKAAKLDKYTLSCGDPKICLCKHVKATFKAYLAVSCGKIFTAYLFYLICKHAFKPKMAWNAHSQFIFHNDFLSKKPP